MKKVYQKIVDKGNGDCWQAVIASLFELTMDEVPHFLSYGEKQWEVYYEFLFKMKHEYCGMIYNPVVFKSGDKLESIRDLAGIDGYFYATVYSPKYYNMESPLVNTHAVVIDKGLNIVHDPNPEYASLKSYPESEIIGYNGIVYVSMINPIQKVVG